jgi:hypothetical protein
MQLPSAANQIRVATDTKQEREKKLSAQIKAQNHQKRLTRPIG